MPRRSGYPSPATIQGLNMPNRVIVHIGGKHRLGTRRLEVADLCRNGQVGAIPDERDLAGAAAGRKPLGIDDRPGGIVKACLAGMG
jgi:hypothetical protein